MIKPLTERQIEFLKYIMIFIEDAGYAPTYREIGANFGIALNAVADTFRYVEKKGYIARDGNVGSRSIAVLLDCEGRPVKLKFVEKQRRKE